MGKIKATNRRGTVLSVTRSPYHTTLVAVMLLCILAPNIGAADERTPLIDYTLSASPSPETPLVVDDDLEVKVNGGTVFIDDDGYATLDGRASWKGEPITFSALPGDELEIIATNPGGGGIELSALYLHAGGESVHLSDGVPNAPGGDLYEFFRERFTISIPATSPSVYILGRPSSVYGGEDLAVTVGWSNVPEGWKLVVSLEKSETDKDRLADDVERTISGTGESVFRLNLYPVSERYDQAKVWACLRDENDNWASVYTDIGITVLSVVDRGGAYMEVGRYQDAVNAFEKAIELDPNNADAWRGKGVALGDLGRCQEALEALDKALELNPAYLDALFHKGVVLDCLGERQEAIAVALKVIDTCDNLIEANASPYHSGNPWHYKASELCFLGKCEDALIASNKALEIDPDNPHTWYGRGVALFELRRYQEAVDAYDKAIEINPNLPNFWLDRANALDALSRPEEADEAYNEAASLETFMTRWISIVILLLLIGSVGVFYAFKRRRSRAELNEAKSTPPTPPHPREFTPGSTAVATQFTTLRTIWDPSSKDFVWGAEKPDEYGELPRIKRWIEDKNPNIYWFLLKIVNHVDHPVTEWNVTLYTEQALTILEAHLDKQQVRIVKSDFDTGTNRNICVVAIPPELGVSIPANGGRRSMYFKIDIWCEDALKMEFGVSGVVKLGKSPQVEVPIREKRFTYACKFGDFENMFRGSPDTLASQVMENLQNPDNRGIMQNFTNSFRLIRDFEKYCNDRYAESEVLIEKLEVVHSSLKAAEPITKDEILPLVEENLAALRMMSGVEVQKERGMRMCEQLIELLHIATSKIR